MSAKEFDFEDGVCDSCEALMINGVYCHEHGCPNAWKNKLYECKWCGEKFKPHFRHQTCCCKGCASVYYNDDAIEWEDKEDE